MQSFFQKRTLFTIIGFILLAFAIGGGVIYPTYRYIKQLDQDTYNLRVTLERKNEQATNYRFAIRQIEKLKVDMPPFSDYLFNSGHELELITTLETLASTHGVTQRINSSNLDNITNQKISISLSISGPYGNALTYLNDLEHLPNFINVNHLSISSIIDRANPTLANNMNMNLELSLYVIP
ncbi:MAG: hypothetical protein AAB467_04825 [Patescibacteria group bacterium]